MTFSEVNLHRCEHGFNHPISDWSIADWYTAVIGELGEAIAEIDCTELLIEELADVYIYLDLLYQRLGYVFPDNGAVLPIVQSKEQFFILLTSYLGRAGNIIKKLRRGDPSPTSLSIELETTLDDAVATLIGFFVYLGVDTMTVVWAKFDKTSQKIGYVR